MNALVYSSSLTAAFLGGILALFAPCCVVTLLPTFIAASLKTKRSRLLVNTIVYASGVAVVLLPLVLSVGALGQILGRFHAMVFLVIGLFLIGLGIYTLSGRGFMLPLPMWRKGPRSVASVGGVFLLGILSGLASSCCAPVLVGVVALSALSSSFIGALGLGLSYVFGMIFPLMLITLLWERWHLGTRRFLQGGPIRIRLGSWSLIWTDLVAGTMFLLMGAVSLFLVITGQGIYTPQWLSTFTRWAAGKAGTLAVALHGVPLFVQALFLFALAGSVIGAVIVAWHHPGTR